MSQNKEYELAFWDKEMKRSDGILCAKYENQVDKYKVDEYFDEFDTIVDLGCGAYGGIFSVREYSRMICVDSLLDEYEKRYVLYSMVKCDLVNKDFDTFNLGRRKADGIICVNALDHSGNIESAAKNIYKQLKRGGVFILGIHFRTNEQLNAGHKTALTKADVESAFSDFELIEDQLIASHGKHPAEYRGWYRK